MLTSKTLWAVDLASPEEEEAFRRNAVLCGATSVAIRTTTANLPALIAEFHAIGITVCGWRWPAVVPSDRDKHPHYFALEEASYVARVLIPAGLDGYFVNPESEKAGARNDWNRPELSGLASSFCSIIRTRAALNGRAFLFGTTSGCIYPAPDCKPDIPWAAFFAASDVLLPQTYWRRYQVDGSPIDLSGGNPRAAVERGMPVWQARAGAKTIIPMSGELDAVTAPEILEYGAILESLGLTSGHFYAETTRIAPDVLEAIRSL